MAKILYIWAMPILIREMDREHHRIDAIAFGPIRYIDIEKHLTEERNIDGLAYKELMDAIDADLVFALNPTEIRQIVSLVRNLCQQCKFGPTAVLVATDYAFGIMRAVEMLLDDVAEIRPFRDAQLARSWLASKPD